MKFKNTTILIWAVIIFLLFNYKLSFSKIIFKQYYGGLPDYEKNSPFNILDTHPDLHNELRKILLQTRVSDRECKSGSINVPGLSSYELRSNICNKSDYERIKKIIGKLAPSLDEKKLTFWIYNIDKNNEPDLIVGFIDLSGDERVQDPYLSLWLLKNDKSKYHVVYAGPFLYGELQNVMFFGPDKNNKMIFIKHQSCTECEPWIYVTIVDFLKKSNGDVFTFTYSENHKEYNPTIEYILPGMGHSVDAEVETRIPVQIDKNGPHLIQHYVMEDKTEEWWVFTCKERKCDYEFFKKSLLPEKYWVLWQKSKKL